MMQTRFAESEIVGNDGTRTESNIEHAACSLCANVESPGFYTGCMIKDGHGGNGWDCDGNGNLTRSPIPPIPSTVISDAKDMFGPSLGAPIAATPPSAGDGEPVAWQTRRWSEDRSEWSDWSDTSKEYIDAYYADPSGRRLEIRPLYTHSAYADAERIKRALKLLDQFDREGKIGIVILTMLRSALGAIESKRLREMRTEWSIGQNLEDARKLIAWLLKQPVGDATSERLIQFRDGLPHGTELWIRRHVDTSGSAVSARATHPQPAPEVRDTQRLDFFEANPGMELSCSYDEADGPWQVYRANGGRNDREWTKISQGATARDAIDAALKSQTPGE